MPIDKDKKYHFDVTVEYAKIWCYKHNWDKDQWADWSFGRTNCDAIGRTLANLYMLLNPPIINGPFPDINDRPRLVGHVSRAGKTSVVFI